MPMKGELAAPGPRGVSQIRSNRYVRNEIVEALRSADVADVLVVPFFSAIGLIITVLLIALFPFSMEIANGIASLS
jgi:hypothetical protein